MSDVPPKPGTLGWRIRALRGRIPKPENRATSSEQPYATQEELAGMLGCTRTMVNTWERNNGAPSPRYRAKLAALAERYGGDPADFVTANPGDGLRPSELAEVVRQAVKEVLEQEQFPRLQQLADVLGRMEVAVARLEEGRRASPDDPQPTPP